VQSYKRIEHEKQMIKKMIHIYCKGNHDKDHELCNECTELLAYARKRLNQCPFKETKKPCAKCVVHCYRPDMREKIKKVMKYAGIRMLFVEPVGVMIHLFEILSR
jgi:predicted amidophosphoribosyltransferase